MPGTFPALLLYGLLCCLIPQANADPTLCYSSQDNVSRSKNAHPYVAIGVLAYRGEALAQQEWQATIDYLSHNVENAQFCLLPLTLPQIHQAVASETLDFLLTNPGNYVELEAKFGVSRIVSLQPGRGDQSGDGTGSVVIVRREREDLQTLKDLRGKSLMAVSQHAFGGFQIVWRELKADGVDPFADLQHLEYVGFPQDQIVYSVLNSKVDAGVLRACVLEHMVQENLINAQTLRVLSPQQHPGFPCETSTRLYPDWPLAKLRSTSSSLAKRVAQTLLAMPTDSAAALAGNYSGWTIPMDYYPVHQLFKELQTGPYRWMQVSTLHQIWDRYWQWIVVALFTLLWSVWHMARVERLVNIRTRQLSRSNSLLQSEIKQRIQAEQRAHQHQTELAHVSRISAVGELASGMAHELNQPLSAINSYAQGVMLRLQSGEIDQQEMADVHKLITTQAERAGTIIQRFRSFLRKEGVACTNVNLNQAVREALELFSSEARQQGVTIKPHLALDVPPVCAELIQVEQVLFNLLHNAADAMQQLPATQRVIEIASTISADETVQIEIRDHGPGIDAETASHLFDPFFTTKENGLGLGLSISQSIMQSHGGRIDMRCHDHDGLSFIVSWPIFPQDDTDE